METLLTRSVERSASGTAASSLVVCWGNPLRGDDGAGSRVAAELARDAELRATVLDVHQLTPELAEDLAAATRVVFVDASVEADGVKAMPLQAEVGRGVQTHRATPEDLMDLARRLYGAAPKAWLVPVPARQFAVGTEVSESTTAAVREAAALVRGLLREEAGAPERQMNNDG